MPIIKSYPQVSNLPSNINTKCK